MFKFVALACLAAASGMPTALESQKMFDDFIVKYHKSYDTTNEYNSRLAIFRGNLQVAEDMNQRQSSSVHGVTKFSDLTPAEFSKFYTTYRPSSTRPDLGVHVPSNKVSLPSSIDWRTKNVVTPVKNQGQCGSCWAFSTVEEIETDWIMAGNSMVELSPQQIVSCDTVDQGCNGGDTVTAYQYVEGAGLETEADYPYTSGIFDDGTTSTPQPRRATRARATTTLQMWLWASLPSRMARKTMTRRCSSPTWCPWAP